MSQAAEYHDICNEPLQGYCTEISGNKLADYTIWGSHRYTYGEYYFLEYVVRWKSSDISGEQIASL
jgi:hypothetical protein